MPHATQGLVLEKNDAESYRRIGWFASDLVLGGWYEGGEEQTNTIF
jgi:hypothetical protein